MIFPLFFLTFAFINVNADSAVRNTWERVIVEGKDVLNETDISSRVFDPYGTRTKAFLGCTDATILEHRAIANAKFIEYYGIDPLGTGIHNPADDTWIVPGLGVMINYANGDNLLFRVVSDSWNNYVEKHNRHITYEWGNGFVFAFGNGIIPGGKLAGKPYYKFNSISYTKIEWLDLKKQSQWNDPTKCDWRCREINTMFSERPGLQYVNSDNLVDNYQSLAVHNQRTNLAGIYTSHVTKRTLDDGVTNITTTRNVITLGGNMVFKLPY